MLRVVEFRYLCCAHTDGAVQISPQLSPTGSTCTASSDSDEGADRLDVSVTRMEHIAEVIFRYIIKKGSI